MSGKKYGDNSISIRRLLYDKSNQAPKDLFDTGINSKLKTVSTIIESLISDVANVSLQQLLDNIIRNAAVLPYIMQHAQKLKLLQLLKTKI